MNSNLEVIINKLKEKTTLEQKNQLRLDIISIMSDLGSQYASNLQDFSQSVINNKEEWYKKSMIECIHQAGREVGYQYEVNKTDIEACKALLQVISDMEKVDQGGSDDLLSNPAQTDSSTTLEQNDDKEEEQKSNFGKTDDMVI
jgi:ABC-type Na+ efflux pump permease subunit